MKKTKKEEVMKEMIKIIKNNKELLLRMADK